MKAKSKARETTISKFYNFFLYLDFEETVELAAQATGALGVSMMGMIGMTMMMSDLNFQQSGQPMGSLPSPGAVGGGGSPIDSSIPSLPASLSLVPDGLTAVAVFPPFAT